MAVIAVDVEQRWACIESERRRLAALLETLTPAQWEHPSLCDRWRVRDVAAHVAMTPAGAPSTWSLVTGVLARRGDLWGYGHDVAVAWAQAHEAAEITRTLREEAASHRMPVVTNAANILLDVVVHSQDVAVPLGADHPVPAAAGEAALARVWSMGWPFHARKRLAGVRLVATDADVEVGEGRVVEGTLGALLLLTTGRTAAARPLVTGPGVDLVA